MAGYSLLIKPSAVKEIESIGSRRDRQRIIGRIQSLEATARPAGCEKLAGSQELFRLRQGSYRIVYSIDDAKRTIDIVKAGHRRDVYRGTE